MQRRDFLRGAGLGAAFAAPAFAAAVPSDGDAKARQDDTCFNVRDFGAKGDGRTSDTAAIQKALDAAGAVSGTVWFPAGEYPCHDLKVRERTCLRADPAWLYRNEKAGAVLRLDDPGARCLLDITGAFGVHLRGLFLLGARPTPKPVHGVLLDNPEKWSAKEDSCVLDDVKVGGFSGHGVYLNRIWLFIIRHCHFMCNGGDGVCIRGWDGFVTDNQFSANGGSGFGCEQVGSTVMFTANRVEWNRLHGLSLAAGSDWNVTGNAFDSNWGAGLCANGTQMVSVTGNTFRRCGRDVSRHGEGAVSCQVRLENCRGVSMTGNTCMAGRDDRGKGPLTPQVGFVVRNLACSVIKDNALYRGFSQELLRDLGGHGEGFIFRDNVGCRMEDKGGQ